MYNKIITSCDNCTILNIKFFNTHLLGNKRLFFTVFREVNAGQFPQEKKGDLRSRNLLLQNGICEQERCLKKNGNTDMIY